MTIPRFLWNIQHLLFVFIAVSASNNLKCNRVIDGITTPRSPVEDKFRIVLSTYNQTDNLNFYMPSTKYTVKIEGNKNTQLPRKFTRFLLSSENLNDTLDAGTFDIEDPHLTAFSDSCPNVIMETTKIPKEEVAVIWTSPPEKSGCVYLRATLVESPAVWYMDDAGLLRKICQDAKAEADEQGPILTDCCACDEAKYEVTFEGHWSRNTHPKDFPSKGWLIRFSDVIGASHSGNYRFWNYNELASQGLKQVAEHGSTRLLETELKEQSENIRTIIKARGLVYPNVTGQTFAVFRVDRIHHLMSVVSMIGPSPDWIVGVSGLELCSSDCTWIEHKEYNLYPYDVGTDDGITYMSPDSPSDPPQKVTRITTTEPNDSRSPFYDPSGLDMKPMAKLYLNRQRLYEKTCEGKTTEHGDSGGPSKNKACRVTPWEEWSPCSVTCGSGFRLRQRKYRDESAESSKKCNKKLTLRQKCFGEYSCDGKQQIPRTDENCRLTEWSDWSSCSATCGVGSKTRSRNFEHKKHRKRCKSLLQPGALQQTLDCEQEPCTDEATEKCQEEQYAQWSYWSPCSSTCGKGFKVRNRKLREDWSNMNVMNDEREIIDTPADCTTQQVTCTAPIESCDLGKEDVESICNEPLAKGDTNCTSHIIRFYYDNERGSCHTFTYTGCDGNRNNFATDRDCASLCVQRYKESKANYSTILKNFKVSVSSVLSYHIPNDEKRTSKTKRAKSENEKEAFNGIPSGSQTIETTEEYYGEKVNCHLSEWSDWGPCNSCKDMTYSTRTILVEPRGGGKKCPAKLSRKKKCRYVDESCTRKGDDSRRRIYRDRLDSTINEEDTLSVDCKLSEWTPWSSCTSSCDDPVRFRTRSIKIAPRGLGKLCPPMIEFQNCPSQCR